MARALGDRLIVNVARKPGEEQLIDLMRLFNDNPNRIITVAGTVGADGAPNTCPVTLIYAKDDRTLLVATLRSSATTANLRRDGRVSLEIRPPTTWSWPSRAPCGSSRNPWPLATPWPFGNCGWEKVKLDTSPAQKVIQGRRGHPPLGEGVRI